jgi:hypothetical protein
MALIQVPSFHQGLWKTCLEPVDTPTDLSPVDN